MTSASRHLVALIWVVLLGLAFLGSIGRWWVALHQEREPERSGRGIIEIEFAAGVRMRIRHLSLTNEAASLKLSAVSEAIGDSLACREHDALD